MSKSADAFRTISEVADELEVPKHVLRFWEVKFPQIKPMKRGGGRRYYRPEDVVLLRGIRHLLHAEGYTIKGVQKILRHQGVDEVKAFGQGGEAPPPSAAGPRIGGRVRKLKERTPTVDNGEHSARDRRARSAVTEVVDAAIRELMACRQMLLALAPDVGDLPDAASAPAAKRSARASSSRATR